MLRAHITQTKKQSIFAVYRIYLSAILEFDAVDREPSHFMSKLPDTVSHYFLLNVLAVCCFSLCILIVCLCNFPFIRIDRSPARRAALALESTVCRLFSP